MARKSDYHKGITAGLAITKKQRRICSMPYAYRSEVEELIRRAGDRYSDQIGDTPCPITGEPSYMRVSWYRDGVHDAIYNGKPSKYVVCKYNGGTARYDLGSLAEDKVYDDPCLAWQRSWQLDPRGHEYTSKDILYVNGACRHFGIEI